MRFLQKIGKSLLIPISCMPICGILMGIGYLLCPAGMQGGDIVGVAAKIGFFLITAGGAVINHMPLLFAIGVGIGMSDGEGNGGLAALVSWLMMTTLLSEATISAVIPSFAQKDTILLALSKIENPFIGILAGLIGALCVKHFKNVRLPSWLSFFSGKRLGIIISGVVSIIVSAILAVLWPLLFLGLVKFGKLIANMGIFGSAVYATLNRLLIPFGLHHALNNVFWFDTVGLGDLTAFWAGKTSADVSWSVGMYMSGFFPSMMFGIPAAALAMRHCAKKKDKRVFAMLFSSALTAFVCGVTEPFEFSFMFASPLLYTVYCVLFGVFTFIANSLGFRAGFSFSAGIIDLIFSASLPAAQKTLLIIPLGIAAFAVYYFVFWLLIKKLDLKTPGREDPSAAESENAPYTELAVSGEMSRAEGILKGLGGKENIVSVSNCATRLRVEVKDNTLCNDEIIKKAGAVNVMKLGHNSVQVVIGMDVEFVADDVNRLLKCEVPNEKSGANSESLVGKVGNGGICVGKVFLMPEKPVPEKKKIKNKALELERFKKALSDVKSDLLGRAKDTGGESANILEAQSLMLDDESFCETVKTKIQSGINAEYAVFEAGIEMAKSFEAMSDDYMKSRALDVRNIAEKLYLSLMGEENGAQVLENPCIVVAEDLTPEQLIGMDKAKMLGLITRKGSANSHTSILAGNYGIPYLYGVEFDRARVEKSELAALDTEDGIFILSPDSETQRRINDKKETAEALLSAADEYSGSIKVCANISSPLDMTDVISASADGIGLFRTEFLYMNRETLPDEEEQFTAYKTVLEGMNGGEVIIRTMDIGADKKTECIKLHDEENPALGKRAIRICLEDTELFRTQLRALLRAATYGNLSVMYPMITSAEEIDAIGEQLKIAASELDQRNEKYKIPSQGIMIETPAAALISDTLAEKVDFFSIGTNDLCQYTLALDRQSEGLERFYRPGHEAVLHLISLTAENAHKKGIKVGICGEMGGNPEFIPLLADMGIDELSMSPKKIRKAKSMLATLAPKTATPVPEADGYIGFEEIGAPADGTLVPMEKIPDEAFSSGVLGKCIGVIPDNGNIYAPCDGTVTTVAKTFHAVGIHSDSGHDVLVHVGINTVTLGGKGFSLKVKVGDRVSKNDLIMTADIDLIKNSGLDTTVITAVTE